MAAFNGKALLITVFVSTCAAVGVYIAFHKALWSVPPWPLQQPYSPPYTEADFPSSFIEGRHQLFISFVPFFCISSAVAGGFLVRSFYGGTSKFSRVAALSVAWPALVFPIVGYFGLFAFLFIAFVVLAAVAIGIQALRRRLGLYDVWTLLPNGLWATLLWTFSGAWFGVYGD
jgi:hypothetical protein